MVRLRTRVRAARVFGRKAVRARPEELDGGGVRWCGETYTADEWEAKKQLWNERYPHISEGKKAAKRTKHVREFRLRP